MSCPTPSSNSYVDIDGFRKDDLFLFTEGEPEEGAVEHRAATGRMHVVSRFQKETFRVDWPLLNEAEEAQLRQILMQVGINVLHTVTYGTPQLIRKWDDTTLAGYGINTDINRVRGKARCVRWSIVHLPRQANKYKATAAFVEA